MPNQGNKSNGKSGVVQQKKSSTMPSSQKRGTASSTKHNKGDNGQKLDTGTSGNGGSKKLPGETGDH
jgi:hypothetical protein